MKQYLDLLRDVRETGEVKTDRTGTGTLSKFGGQKEYDLRDGFPAVTTKRVALGTVAHELLWMTHGDRNIQYLAQNNVNIWNEWPFVAYMKKTGKALPPQGSDEWQAEMADYLSQIKTDDAFAEEFGDLGPVYGYQWRHWPDGTFNGVDQLSNAQDTIRNNPDSRRNIVSAWNVADIDEMSKSGLPPCHYNFQFYVSNDGRLDMKMAQRSADMFLGVPFNIAQYAMLLTMMAQTTDTTPGKLIHTLGDTHIYLNHLNQVDEQLSREPLPLPQIELNPAVKDVTEFTRADIKIIGYESHSPIKAPVAI